MKISVLIVILLIGLCTLGFVVEEKTGAVTDFLSQYEILNLDKEKNQSNKINDSESKTSGLSINLPESFTMSSGRVVPSSFEPFEREVTSVEKKDQQEGWVEQMFSISQYLSKNDFDQALAKSLDPKSYPGIRIVSAPVENLAIDGQVANHHVLSDYGDTATYGDEILQNMHFISVPSKFTIISFENIPDFPQNVFTISETIDIISLIKFGSPLVSEAKSQDEVTAISKNIISRQEFSGISVGLPLGVSMKTIASTKGLMSVSTALVDQIFVMVNESGGIVIEKNLSQDDFNKTLANISTMNKNAADEGFTVFSPENYKIGGEDATQHHSTLNGVDMYTIVVPSKRVTINFVLQVLVPYALTDVQNIISTITFNY